MIHPRHNAYLARKNKRQVKKGSKYLVPCWECHGLRMTDDGQCKVCWGKGQVVWDESTPNPMGMNPVPGPERN